MKHLASLSLCLSVLTACAHLPSRPSSRGLFVDIEKAVEFRAASVDWVVDDLEVATVLPNVMGSVCSVEAPERKRLQTWLVQAIAHQGGSSKALYKAHGGLDSAVKDLRTLERVEMVLRAATRVAETRCPYWVEEREDFRGKESDDARFVAFGETHGGANLQLSGGNATLGAGGGLRLLLGAGFSGRYTLVSGLEMGGGGSFVEADAGMNAITGRFSAAIPLLLRISHAGAASQIVDVELAATTTITSQGFESPGLRAGVGFGLSTPRVSQLMPYALLWIGYEILPPSNGRLDAAHRIWIGTRVGFDWDP